MTTNAMLERLYRVYHNKWLDYFYKKLEQREDFNWAVCETYNHHFNK